MFDFLRNLTKTEEERQQEKLSAYLDNVLTPQEQRQFEEQLAADTMLQADLEQQSLIKQNLAGLPKMRAPHNFTLDPALYGRPAPQPAYQLYPIMRTATAVVAIFLVMLFSLELLNPPGNSAGTAAQVPQVLSETTATDTSLMRGTEVGRASDPDDGSAADAEPPAAEPEIMNDEAGAAEEAVAEVEEAAAAEEPMEEALITSQAESEIITDTVEPAGETAPAPYPEPVTDGFAYNGVIATPTQQLTPTGTIEMDTPSGGDDNLGIPPTPANDTDRQNSTPSTLRVLQIGLGLLFFVLLAGTLLLRRQL